MLANANGLSRTGRAPSDQSVPWTPLNDLLGFDPYQHIRSNYGSDCEVTRTERGYDVEVPVPGFSSSQVDVSFKDGVLNIAGKTERRTFSRSFTIPEDVDVDGIEARVQDGMLTIALPRRPEAQPKKIRVN